MDNNKQMILVFGGTGRTGRFVIQNSGVAGEFIEIRYEAEAASYSQEVTF